MGRPDARRARATRSSRITSQDGMPLISRRSCPAASAATASSRSSHSGMAEIAGPGEYRPRRPGGSLRTARPDRSPTRLPAPAGRAAVLPPRNSIGPPTR